jgi:hypothetical protein
MNNELYEVSIKNKEMQSKIESDKNAIESAATQAKIRCIEQEFMKEQLALIFNSFSIMTSNKLVADRYESQIMNLQADLSAVEEEKEELDK